MSKFRHSRKLNITSSSYVNKIHAPKRSHLLLCWLFSLYPLPFKFFYQARTSIYWALFIKIIVFCFYQISQWKWSRRITSRAEDKSINTHKIPFWSNISPACVVLYTVIFINWLRYTILFRYYAIIHVQTH